MYAKNSIFFNKLKTNRCDRDEPLTMFAPPLCIRPAFASLRSRQPLQIFLAKNPTRTFDVRAKAASEGTGNNTEHCPERLQLEAEVGVAKKFGVLNISFFEANIYPRVSLALLVAPSFPLLCAWIPQRSHLSAILFLCALTLFDERSSLTISPP